MDGAILLLGTFESFFTKVNQAKTITPSTIDIVTAGGVFFFGGVRGAGVSDFFLLRLAGLSVSLLFRAILPVQFYKLRNAQAEPSACIKKGSHRKLFYIIIQIMQ